MYHHRTPYLVKPGVRVPSLVIRPSNFSLDSQHQRTFNVGATSPNSLSALETITAISSTRPRKQGKNHVRVRTKHARGTKLSPTCLLSLPKPMLCAPTTQAKLRCCIADHSAHLSTGVVLFTTEFSASLSSPTPQVGVVSSTAKPPITFPTKRHFAYHDSSKVKHVVSQPGSPRDGTRVSDVNIQICPSFLLHPHS